MLEWMKTRAWRVKCKNNVKRIQHDVEKLTGIKISIDQLVVAQPGLMTNMSGKYTHDRICGDT